MWYLPGSKKVNDSNDGQQILLKVRWLLIFLLLTNLKNIIVFTNKKAENPYLLKQKWDELYQS